MATILKTELSIIELIVITIFFTLPMYHFSAQLQNICHYYANLEISAAIFERLMDKL